MSTKTCRLPGCVQPVLRPHNGGARPAYCSERCALAAAAARTRTRRVAAREARKAARAAAPRGVCRRPGCGGELLPSQGPVPRVWCSLRCRYLSRNRRALDVCQRPTCGAPLGKGRQRFCSDACADACRPPRPRKRPPVSLLPPPKPLRPVAPGERICLAHGCPVRFQARTKRRLYCSKTCRKREWARRKSRVEALLEPPPPERLCAREGCPETFRTAQPDRRFCSTACHKATVQCRASVPPPLPAACPQCGAAGALRRSGRDLYCAERCGYYLTPGQRRQAA